MIRQPTALIAAGFIGIVLIVGCGGSGDSPDAMTKAQFVEQGNRICSQIEQKRIAIANAAAAKAPPGQALPPWELEHFVPVLLSTYKKSAQEIGDLEPPVGEEAKVRELLASFERSYAKAEKERHAVVVGTSTVFKKPDELATRFGLKKCVL